MYIENIATNVLSSNGINYIPSIEKGLSALYVPKFFLFFLVLNDKILLKMKKLSEIEARKAVFIKKKR